MKDLLKRAGRTLGRLHRDESGADSLDFMRTGGAAGKTAAIFGAGPIGLCVLMSLKQADAGAVAVTDIRPWRRELASARGADWTGDPRGQNVADEIYQMRGGGVDIAFECAGEQETVDQCAAALKPGGVSGFSIRTSGGSS